MDAERAILPTLDGGLIPFADTTWAEGKAGTLRIRRSFILGKVQEAALLLAPPALVWRAFVATAYRAGK